jgi:hypothetical protein
LKGNHACEVNIDHLVEQACEGDDEALEAIVISIQDRIYNLALRMLWHPSDAEDATQEILMMEPNCRLVNESKECNCVRHLDQSSSAEKRRLATLLATHPLEVSALKPDAGLLTQALELRQLERVAAIYRSHPSFATPDR